MSGYNMLASERELAWLSRAKWLHSKIQQLPP